MTDCILWQTVYYDRLYIMTDCTLWQTVYYDRLYIMTDCILWQTVYYDRLYIMTDCTLWQTVHYDRLYVMTDCTLWQTVYYDRLYIMTDCILWQTVYYDRLYIMTDCILWQTVYYDSLYIMTACIILWQTVYYDRLYIMTDCILWLITCQQYPRKHNFKEITFSFLRKLCACNYGEKWKNRGHHKSKLVALFVSFSPALMEMNFFKPFPYKLTIKIIFSQWLHSYYNTDSKKREEKMEGWAPPPFHCQKWAESPLPAPFLPPSCLTVVTMMRLNMGKEQVEGRQGTTYYYIFNGMLGLYPLHCSLPKLLSQ